MSVQLLHRCTFEIEMAGEKKERMEKKGDNNNIKRQNSKAAAYNYLKERLSLILVSSY